MENIPIQDIKVKDIFEKVGEVRNEEALKVIVEAVENASKANYDVIFLDENMPGISGLDALALIKKDKHLLKRMVLFSLMWPLDFQKLHLKFKDHLQVMESIMRKS